MAGGAAGASGAWGSGTWPWTAATVAGCAALPEPPRGGRASPPPVDRAGCQGVVSPPGAEAPGSVGSSGMMSSQSPALAAAVVPPATAVEPPAAGFDPGTIVIGRKSP